MRRRTGPVTDADDAAAHRRSRRGVAWDTSGSAQQKSHGAAEDENEDALHTTKHKHRSHAHRHRRKDSERDERAPSQLPAHKGRKRAHSPEGGAVDEPQHVPVHTETASPPLAGDWIREGNRSPTFGSDRPTSPAGTHARSPEPVAYDLSATMAQILKNVQAAHSDVAILPQPEVVMEEPVWKDNQTEIKEAEETSDPTSTDSANQMSHVLHSGMHVTGGGDPVTKRIWPSPYFQPVDMSIVVANNIRIDAKPENTGTYSLVTALTRIAPVIKRKFYVNSNGSILYPDEGIKQLESDSTADYSAAHIINKYRTFRDATFKDVSILPELQHLGIYIIDKVHDAEFQLEFSLGTNISPQQKSTNAHILSRVVDTIFFRHGPTKKVHTEGACVGYKIGEEAVAYYPLDADNEAYVTPRKLLRIQQDNVSKTKPQTFSRPMLPLVLEGGNSYAVFITDLISSGVANHWVTVVLHVPYEATSWEWTIYDILYDANIADVDNARNKMYGRLIYNLVNVIVKCAVFSPILSTYTKYGAKLVKNLKPLFADAAPGYDKFLSDIGITGTYIISNDFPAATEAEYAEIVQYEFIPEEQQQVLVQKPTTTRRKAPKPKPGPSVVQESGPTLLTPTYPAERTPAAPTAPVRAPPPRLDIVAPLVTPPASPINTPYSGALSETAGTSTFGTPIGGTTLTSPTGNGGGATTPSSVASSVAPPGGPPRVVVVSPGSPVRSVLISPGPMPVVIPTKHPSAVQYAPLNQIEEVEQYTPIGTPSLVIVPEIRRGTTTTPTAGSSAPRGGAVSSTVVTRTAVVSRTPGIYPTPQAFTATGRLSTTRSIYADGGAWLVAKRTCARCHLPYIEAASNGMLQCWAHRDPVPVESDLPGYEIAHVRVYECCGRAFVPDLTPLLLAREYAQTRRENVAAYMSDNNISTLTADMQHMMTIQAIQGSQIQTGCVPVDHCTAEQIDLCRVRGIPGFEVQYTKELVARVWGAGPRGVKLFLDTVPQMGSTDVKSDVFAVFKKIVPEKTDAVN